jgi:hypothetical protein
LVILDLLLLLDQNFFSSLSSLPLLYLPFSISALLIYSSLTSGCKKWTTINCWKVY